ncbi:hypothetical protein CDL15_Pgr015171 [Punica granatum]|uniref:Uncharacterized protein n=1 Tax=Punica granatum TaxID=22663 RepID=A0A218VYS6_PUNGR|nr:hypothetical protein CDL15_Pgr015171 [Punica granatum]
MEREARAGQWAQRAEPSPNWLLSHQSKPGPTQVTQLGPKGPVGSVAARKPLSQVRLCSNFQVFPRFTSSHKNTYPKRFGPKFVAN